MKRICTEAEKEVLFKNRKRVLEGIYQTASKSSLGTTLAGIFLAAIIAIAGMAGIASIYELPMVGLLIVMVVFFVLARMIFSAIFNEIRISRDKKKFLKQDKLMVNGATVISASEDGFLYIEDGFVREDGKPIVIEYPTRFTDIPQVAEGDRLVVIYASDISYQLMTMNDELVGMIPLHSSQYPLTEDPNVYTYIPHPSVLGIEKEEKKISEGEREKYADLYVKESQGASFNMFKKAGLGLVIAVAVLCGLLSIGEDGYPLEKSLPVALGGMAALALLFGLAAILGKKNLRRIACQFETVKEVVFHSYEIKDSAVTIYVYEWIDGKIRLKEYSQANIASNTPYGTCLYKFTDKKGKEILVCR